MNIDVNEAIKLFTDPSARAVAMESMTVLNSGTLLNVKPDATKMPILMMADNTSAW